MRRSLPVLVVAALATGIVLAAAPVASAATAPDAPSYVGASWPGAGIIALTWTRPDSNGGSAITDYKILVTHQTSGGDVALPVIDTQSTKRSYTVSNLTDGDYYLFQVASVNVVGDSDWSYVDDSYSVQSVPGLFDYHDVTFKTSWVNGQPSWNIGAFVDKWPTGVTTGRLCASLSFAGDPHGHLDCSNAQYTGTLHAPAKTVWFGHLPLRQPISIYAVPYDAANQVYGVPGWVTVPADKLTSTPARTVHKGAKIVLSTRLTDTTGAILDSRMLLLVACRRGTCTKIGAPVTNSKGIAHKTVQVEASTTYRWSTGVTSNGQSVIPAFAADAVHVS